MLFSDPPIELSATKLPSPQGSLQTLAITLTRPQTLLKPSSLPRLQLPLALDLSQEVVLYGRSPTWLYGYLIHQCRSAPWIGIFDARSQSVIVIHSRGGSPAIGDQIPIKLNRQPCPAILIGGPPNSGKSVLSNAIRLSLIQHWPQATVYLHRASWDGEGNWTYETPQPDLVSTLVRQHEYRIHADPETAKLIPSFFQYHAETVKNLRHLVDCLLVDVGGTPQPEKLSILQQCSSYIVISRLPEAIPSWHTFGQTHASPLAVIHSVLSTTLEVHQTTPWLEIKAGPWIMGKTKTIPDCLLQTILRHVQSADSSLVKRDG